MAAVSRACVVSSLVHNSTSPLPTLGPSHFRPIALAPRCCTAAATLSASSCICNSEMEAHLHNWLNEQGGLEFEFVLGALAMIDMADVCRNPVPPCLAIPGVQAPGGTR